MEWVNGWSCAAQLFREFGLTFANQVRIALVLPLAMRGMLVHCGFLCKANLEPVGQFLRIFDTKGTFAEALPRRYSRQGENPIAGCVAMPESAR